MRWILLILSLILLSFPVIGVDIYVERDGTVLMDGEISQDYTFKDKVYWLLNLTLDEDYGEYSYSLHFPENTVINYMKLPSLSNIKTEKGELILSGEASGKPSFVVQYVFRNGTNDSWMLPMIFFIILVIGLLLYFWKSSKKIDKRAMTEREKMIVEILEKKKITTQAEIEKITKLPKASLSRNIDTLVRKGILKKENTGMTNTIMFQDVPGNSGKN